MKELIFGTAGIPASTIKPTTLTGIKRIRELKLSCMEMAFVQSVYLNETSAIPVKKTAKENDVILTAHAPYFVNLNAIEKKKIEASKYRIFKTAKIAELAGAYSICYHAGFYLKQDPKNVYDNILHNLKDLMKKIDDEGIKIWVRPETTGKPTQFGDLKELLKISSNFDNVMPCIDFAHLHARTGGKENTKEEFRNSLSLVEKTLGKKGLNNMHIHLSGIAYSEKGERHHLPLDDSDMNYKDLCKVWKEFKIKGVVICESPIMEKDAIKLKKTFLKLS